MIFVSLGIGVLVISFIIAFISLLKEQNKIMKLSSKNAVNNVNQEIKKENVENKNNLVDRINLAPEISHHLTESSKLTNLNQKNIEHSKDESFPWEEPIATDTLDIKQFPGHVTETGGEIKPHQQKPSKLGGTIQIGELINKTEVK
ncbi:hypothetical protein A3F02_00430 [Candidatus Curtissbacteria bacterium RIFCSPHIGHO2_12_FULL_38_9b]|uniref:Uncharacterized protein n=2 Tax=Candidatus Curtissiibacteriota TaxID=1752717 RepID=A0A1F5GZ45_9BACT|nr:MAG: hypothetical protein A3A48_02340 [Candidatus Curtissbacteria bacterium RIFCSPLOWO2_01_FULL_37_9]OGD97089.1 MAG: hypothetical protein A3F02_00430 [Candidatus Curtissbacteria bacterium RIFCSPHIGHO2_12_FULL_38_9b]